MNWLGKRLFGKTMNWSGKKSLAAGVFLLLPLVLLLTTPWKPAATQAVLATEAEEAAAAQQRARGFAEMDGIVDEAAGCTRRTVGQVQQADHARAEALARETGESVPVVGWVTTVDDSTQVWVCVFRGSFGPPTARNAPWLRVIVPADNRPGMPLHRSMAFDERPEQ